jgi:hypothetical protein
MGWGWFDHPQSKERKREEEVEEYTTSNCFYHFIDFALVGDIFFY